MSDFDFRMLRVIDRVYQSFVLKREERTRPKVVIAIAIWAQGADAEGIALRTGRSP